MKEHQEILQSLTFIIQEMAANLQAPRGPQGVEWAPHVVPITKWPIQWRW
jgi:hypothetical protein